MTTRIITGPIPLTILGFLFFGALVYANVQVYTLSGQLASLSSTTALLASTTVQSDAGLGQKITTVSDSLYISQQNIEAIQNRLGGFEKTVGTISGTVGVLEKLSKTDPELLQKYSKVFFLNEHYAPERLLEINQQYVYSNTRPEKIHALVLPYLNSMFAAAQGAGTPLFVKSAYRSFDEQASLKSSYSVTYGAGTANQFSADQGYSEHQLGTTVDFITTGQSGQLEGFDKTNAYQWLLANAYRYGFVLSYPKGNKYYVFEPWHWRYVGVKLATYLYEQKKNFYDMEQREIDEYLAVIFD